MEFTIKEIKEICNKLNKENCYFRHPQEDFIKILGQTDVDRLIKIGWLKNSPKLTNIKSDYYKPCYEFGMLFRRIFNYLTTPFWTWLSIYVFQFFMIKIYWQKFMIKVFNKHYDWQDYVGLDLNEI